MDIAKHHASYPSPALEAHGLGHYHSSSASTQDQNLHTNQLLSEEGVFRCPRAGCRKCTAIIIT